MAGLLERDVAVLLGGQRLPLGPEHLQGPDESGPGLPGLDDLVDQAAFGGDVGVGERRS